MALESWNFGKPEASGGIRDFRNCPESGPKIRASASVVMGHNRK
jgi:hypothetical protein